MAHTNCTSTKAGAPPAPTESASSIIAHFHRATSGAAQAGTSARPWDPVCHATDTLQSFSASATPLLHKHRSRLTSHSWEPACQPDRRSGCSNEQFALQQGTPARPCGQRVHAVDSPQGCPGLGYGRRHGASCPASWSTPRRRLRVKSSTPGSVDELQLLPGCVGLLFWVPFSSRQEPAVTALLGVNEAL